MMYYSLEGLTVEKVRNSVTNYWGYVNIVRLKQQYDNYMSYQTIPLSDLIKYCGMPGPSHQSICRGSQKVCERALNQTICRVTIVRVVSHK